MDIGTLPGIAKDEWMGLYFALSRRVRRVLDWNGLEWIGLGIWVL